MTPKRRFSLLVFLIVTVVHLAGTGTLWSLTFRLLTREGVPSWFTALCWIWDSGPLLFQHVCRLIYPHLRPNDLYGDPCSTYIGPILIGWSLVVGILCGFLAPRFRRLQATANDIIE